MSNIWFTSDEHIGHANIILPTYCNRPFKDVDHMREVFIENHNSVVGPNDTVYHLGDLSMNHNKGAEYLKRLNGQHYLISGNHDKCWKGQEKWVQFYLDAGFKYVYTRGMFPRIFCGEYEFAISHLPYESHDDRYKEWLPTDNSYTTLLHGHKHSKPENKITYTAKGTLQYDVGVDPNLYYPVDLEYIINEISKHI